VDIEKCCAGQEWRPWPSIPIAPAESEEGSKGLIRMRRERLGTGARLRDHTLPAVATALELFAAGRVLEDALDDLWRELEVKLQAVRMVTDAKGLHGILFGARKVNGSCGEIERIAVQMEYGHSRGEGSEHRIAYALGRELDMSPSDLLAGPGMDVGPECARQQLRAEADPEHRTARGGCGTNEAPLGSKRGVALRLVHPHGSAQDHEALDSRDAVRDVGARECVDHTVGDALVGEHVPEKPGALALDVAHDEPASHP
jgi:hypothetical protein